MIGFLLLAALLIAAVWKAGSRLSAARAARRRTSKLANGDVVIVGTGFSGICAAVKLQELGIPFTILEKTQDVGGAWNVNSYPGCECDIPSHLYSFSFARKMDWKTLYGKQDEIQKYVRGVAEDFGLIPHIRFGCALVKASWDSESGRYAAELSDGTTLRPRFLIGAQGPLHHPNYPSVPGLEDFKGPTMHSCQWDHTVDLTDKRVAVVGSAASAIQLVPRIAERARHLTLFQRSPNWVAQKFQFAYPRWAQRAFQVVPLLELAHRYALYWMHEAFFLMGLFDRDSWLQRLARKRLARVMASVLRHDPALVTACVPSFDVGCKRILKSDDYLQTLTRPHVTLVPAGLARVEPAAVVARAAAGGQQAEVRAEVDVIIYATGFRVGAFGYELVGLRDARLNDNLAADGVEAFLGCALRDFPNFFLVLGPNSGNGHQSGVVVIEAQVSYIVRTIAEMIDADVSSAVVKPAVVAAHNHGIQSAMQGRVWSNDVCRSWYVNKQGKNTANTPFSTVHLVLSTTNAPRLEKCFETVRVR